MKILKKITLTSFRNYSFSEFLFNSSITCITGANGSGKTNLLDAVYYLCYTKSYFTASQQHIAQNGGEGFRLEAQFANGEEQEKIACKWKQGKKELQADGVDYERVTDHIGKYTAVMIAPDDLELINGGSELRRKWIDSVLVLTDRRYLDALMKYQKVLQQRNAWLKQEALKPTGDNTALDFYNQNLVADGTYIYDCRKAFLEEYIHLLKDFYAELSGGKEASSIEYKTDLNNNTLENLLKQSLQNDLYLQRTTKGVHKDDLTFLLNESPTKQYASQGQKKSFLFALKLAQYAYLSQKLGNYPILLLDDIFEKLDEQRIKALLKIIHGTGFGQVLITDTHADRIRDAFGEGAEVDFIGL
ncbi:MAG: DNA replication and repair protein RecF [Flavipsychrobacter sp.]